MHRLSEAFEKLKTYPAGKQSLRPGQISVNLLLRT